MKKIYFLLCALLCTMAASAADYYLVGNFNKWALADANAKFTDNGDGTYVLDFNNTLISGFKINDGTWDNGNANWGTNGSELVIGETYNLNRDKNSDNITIAQSIEKPHIVFNPSENTLLITGKEAQSVITYAIHGQIVPGNQDWNDKDLTENEGAWTATFECNAGNFGIKKLNNGNQISWISADGNAAVVLNQPMPAKENDNNWSLSEAGEYTFSFNPKAMTLTVTKVGDEDPDPVVEYPENLYVLGNIAGGWWNTMNGVKFNKNEDNIYQADNVNIEDSGDGFGYFSLVSKLAADNTGSDHGWNEVNGSHRYGAPAEDTPLSTGVAATMVKSPANVSASSAKSWKVAPGTYNMVAKFDNNEPTIYIADPSGVEDIESADNDATPVYYNLQGVQVENPSTGLYIEVRGASVRKVQILR